MVYGGDGISAVQSFKNRLGKCLLKSADISGLGFGRVTVYLKCLHQLPIFIIPWTRTKLLTFQTPMLSVFKNSYGKVFVNN